MSADLDYEQILPRPRNLELGGLVYVLHFVDPVTGRHKRLAHAGHYVGYCGRGLDSRLAYHRARRGSRLIAAVLDAGLDFVVAFTMPGSRTVERTIKTHTHNVHRDICPLPR